MGIDAIKVIVQLLENIIIAVVRFQISAEAGGGRQIIENILHLFTVNSHFITGAAFCRMRRRCLTTGALVYDGTDPEDVDSDTFRFHETSELLMNGAVMQPVAPYSIEYI